MKTRATIIGLSIVIASYAVLLITPLREIIFVAGGWNIVWPLFPNVP